MKMIMKLSDEDINLLKHDIPDSPCMSCRMCSACCGCNKGDEYNKIIKPYKDNGIYDYALQIKELKNLKNVSIIASTKLRDGTGMSIGFVTHDLLMQANGKYIITDPKSELKDEKRVNSTE